MVGETLAVDEMLAVGEMLVVDEMSEDMNAVAEHL